MRFVLLLAVAAVCLAGNVRAAVPLDLWPAQPAVPDKAALSARIDELNAALPSLPQPLKPAAQFQKVFLQILSGAPPASWRAEIERLAALPAGDPVSDGVRDVSKAWLARLQMLAIDGALHGYYRGRVRFPATLAEVESTLPPALLKDPWGVAWAYSPRAPQGFARLAAQRYQLAPGRLPNLPPLADAVRHRTAPDFAWTPNKRDIGGSPALEFRSARPGASTTPLLQPGGKIESFTLLFIGDNWALLAGTDQLFAVSFSSKNL